MPREITTSTCTMTYILDNSMEDKEFWQVLEPNSLHMLHSSLAISHHSITMSAVRVIFLDLKARFIVLTVLLRRSPRRHQQGRKLFHRISALGRTLKILRLERLTVEINVITLRLKSPAVACSNPKKKKLLRMHVDFKLQLR